MSESRSFDIPTELKKLPKSPGVYIMKNESGQVIYVGKAVNLHNRVRSYFQPTTSIKTQNLSANISEFEYIVTSNEVEALILECNLIKKHNPKYNILLKDDKAYPFISVTMHEDFPRVMKSFRRERDKAKYYGPFVSNTAIFEFLKLIHKIWPLRTCSKQIKAPVSSTDTPPANIRPCLNHDMGRCLAPCCCKVTKEAYAENISAITRILDGKADGIIKQLEAEMKQYSEELEFEKAAEIRNKINAINHLTEKQKVSGDMRSDSDVIAAVSENDDALVQVFFIRDGKMIGREHYMLSNVGDQSKPEILSAFIKQFYGEAAFIPKEIILEEEIEDTELVSSWLSELRGTNVTLTVPKRADKLKLVQMASDNAALMLKQFGAHIKKEKERSSNALKELSDAIGTVAKKEYSLNRIEAYDISNIQGFESVGSMVVFENGKQKNSDYRKFKIKYVVGADDVASMAEVVRRRFMRYLDETRETDGEATGNDSGKFSKLPDLLLIDGGKNQVHAVERVLEELGLSIPVCGMIKDDRHRTKALLHADIEISLPTHKEGFKLLTRIQDEVHRFAIEYHRKLRADSQVKSVLDDIEGIGPTRRKNLLRHFKSIDAIKDASIEDLTEVDGMNRKSAEAVYTFFHA